MNSLPSARLVVTQHRPIRRLFSMGLMTLIFTANLTTNARGQSTEEQFTDLFVTAGYAAAFGAALGAATLSFKSQPERHLRFVAVGASLGFIGGSALGSYLIFSPVFTTDQATESADLLASSGHNPSQTWTVQPHLNMDSGRITAISGVYSLETF